MSVLGVVAIIYVLIDYFVFGIETAGGHQLYANSPALFRRSLVMLGLVGEYIGHIYLTVNERPCHTRSST